MACSGDPHGPPLVPLLSKNEIAGTYRLTHIAAAAEMGETPVPAWTWPGRVLVLEGSLTFRQDGRYVASGRSRLTLFGDTTYAAGTDSASWELKPGNVIQFTTGMQFPEDQARVGKGVVVVYAGGFGSGGTVSRYQRQ
jgi:hypothetical protein